MAYTEDDAVRHAVDRAARGAGASFTVYVDGEKVFYVRASEAAPPAATVVCIAQSWDSDTVQVRFPGGRSEYVKV